MLQVVRVLLPVPLNQLYHYVVPNHLDISLGQVVHLPFGKKILSGVVWSLEPTPQKSRLKKIKEIIDVLPVPPIPEISHRFVEWVANYTLAPLGSVLKMVISVPEALFPYKKSELLILKKNVREVIRSTPQREKLIKAMEQWSPPFSAKEAAERLNVSRSVVRGLINAGAFERSSLPPSSFESPYIHHRPVKLTKDQAAVAQNLCKAVTDTTYTPFLLDGVTGSGKTEVYFEAIAEALSHNRQVLVLLPEIALSTQWLQRFEYRFGVEPVLWHSDLTKSQRRCAWRAIIEGMADVIVGARSALYLPYPNLGLIVVDEEHEASYKQEEGVTYHARDMAVVRAYLGNFPIILATATPSLESYINCKEGRYRRLSLPSRHGKALFPDVHLIDMRDMKRSKGATNSWLAPPLVGAIEETVSKGEQSMLFLNRRGYAPMTLCGACGSRLSCPQCTAWLVEHRSNGYLSCHHCGYVMPYPKTCASCEAVESFVPCGPGIERIAEEITIRFPGLRFAVIASDTVEGPKAMKALVEQIQSGEISLIIGTQIMAKGHHFPNLTLVGVIDADLGLSGCDLRACERTYQLLHQVGGRAGRENRPGRVFLQTHLPDHPVMQAMLSQDRDRFIGQEISSRQILKLPPFGRLGALIISSPNESYVETTARELSRCVPPDLNGIEIIGPAPAPMVRIRGKYRWRFLIKAERGASLQRLIRQWVAQITPPSSVRIKVDVDPYSFL